MPWNLKLRDKSVRSLEPVIGNHREKVSHETHKRIFCAPVSAMGKSSKAVRPAIPTRFHTGSGPEDFT